MENLSQKALSLWSKKSKDGSLFWLPLATHIADSAVVAQKLWNRWLSGGVKQAVDTGIAENECAERLFVFLSAVHDLGKATLVFQAKKSACSELDKWTAERIKVTGLPMKPTSLFYTRVKNSARFGNTASAGTCRMR
ncbi:MAG: HD domain-containing protein [Bacillota bacterium]